MASSFDSQQPPLKEKLSQVKHLLNDANERLQEEASKYGIFTTKTSAAGSATTILTRQNNMNPQDVPTDLKRTMNDISTIQSVLMCPVFNQIVNVTDSLSKLSHHLNLRPSIGPTDINFDVNGELILKPPIEPMGSSFNNLINSRLDEFPENPNHSNHIMNSNYINNSNNINLNGANGNDLDQNVFNGLQQHQMRIQQVSANSQFDVSSIDRRTNGFAQQVDNQILSREPLAQHFENQPQNEPIIKSMILPNTTTSPRHGYDTEKLVANGTQTHMNGNEVQNFQQSRVAAVAAAFEANSTQNQGRRLYKANGHQALNQMVPSDMEVKRDFESARSMNQIKNEQSNDSQGFGYSNDLYKTTNELNRTEGTAIRNQVQVQAPTNGRNEDAYMNELQTNGNPVTVDRKCQAIQNNHNKQNRASPSTSAGSTVRLADECDSGTSSFRSQAAKANVHSPQPQKLKQNETYDETLDSSIDQELIEKLSPEMERIKVVLEKDSNGLGITIAGYTCEQEEISGIFIKSITPGSPADRSGKISILDQIFAVNGQEILGYSNPEAVNVLRKHTGPVVTLELMRYLADSKFRKLQSLLGHASQSSGIQGIDSQPVNNANNYNESVACGANKTRAPATEASVSSPVRPLGLSGKHNISYGEDQPVESLYKNTSVFYKTEPSSTYNEDLLSMNENDASNAIFHTNSNQIPVAAQRGTSSNKIIETKQGARNKIDIRSPMCQTTATATYVNKVVDMDTCDSGKPPMTARIHQQSSDDLSFGQIIKSEEPEWEKDVRIVELDKGTSKGLGFHVKEYANPKDRKQSIIMITSLTPGGVAEMNGGLSFGDLLKFVDDTSLEGASLAEAVNAIKNTSGEVRLGVLKLKRN